MNIIYCVCLFLSGWLHATNNELFFGDYRSINAKIQIEFSLNENGATNFVISRKKFKNDNLSIDFLGRFGGSELLEISFDDENKRENVIRLLAVVINDRVKLVTGYHIIFTCDEKNKTHVRHLAPVSFRFKQRQIP